MAQSKERDSMSPSTGQSKRPSHAHDSDSLDSDQAQHAHSQGHSQQQQQQSHQHRKHQTKHHVAGGRLHARVPSSKALNKHTNSSSKLTRRITSPSPDRSGTTSTLLTSSSSTNHRRHHSSDVKLSRDPSATNLNKNASQTSLKRNKSHVDVGKRSKSSGNLKRSASEKAVNRVKPSRSAVHFDLGTDGQNDEDGDDWVDASSSASPYLSRRGSVNASGQSSANANGSPTVFGGKQARKATAKGDDNTDGEEEPTPLADPNKTLFDDDDNKVHSRNLTSRLLQRTPSHSATTSMSTTMAMAKAASPDSRHSASTLSVMPASVEPQGMAGSNGTVDVTSRFITTQNSGGSFYTPAEGVRADKRPASMGGLSGPAEPGLSTATTKVSDDDEDDLTDKEDTGIASAIATTARSRKPGIPAAVSVEKSRTQQKINLQRASSSMEPVRHRHSGIGGFAAEVAEVAGPLLGGAGYEAQDPRVNKLLERTGVEYNIVRRYQNPVARSLVRLAQLPGNDKARRIPRGAPSNRHSVHTFGLSQSFRETNGNGPKRPETPKRAYSSIRHSGTGSSFDTDDGGAAARMQEGIGAGHRLSGASLVNGEEDEGIQAILRGLWDKNLVDLAASAD
ncbi:hypothetical protein N0V93_002862 [Gnomoniopsis smithogilvyi]|uniref:Uncharacterized protein n=1 Tax=Gnomoniopsis smithogilvyi TaxID=1191159 RepID=A0A9W8YYA5_9PEZI|nr:hypothetical protein N0V93_002862 [Gnomoniopsis smithogilvyi]